MTTQTPRTDAAQLTFAGVNGMVRYAVPADFARQLERDLAAAQEELAAIRKTLGSEMVLVHEARTDREMLRNALVKESGFRQETERQLAAAKSELERVRDKCNEHYMALAAAREALNGYIKEDAIKASVNKMLEERAERAEALAEKIKQILLPDPHDEREVSAEWQVKAIHAAIDAAREGK